MRWARMRRLVRIMALVLFASGFGVAHESLAQNVDARASYGEVQLQAGFLPDPYSVGVRAGGDLYLTHFLGCQPGGWFANSPDFRIHFQAGNAPLSIYVRAPGDTMLLVNAPDGRWSCNDDFQGFNPALVFNPPLSGRYEIWVGTYDRTRVRNAVIYISELGPFSQ